MKEGPFADLRLELSRKTADYYQKSFQRAVEASEGLQLAGLWLRELGITLRRVAIFAQAYFSHPKVKKALHRSRLMYTPALSRDEFRHNQKHTNEIIEYFRQAAEESLKLLDD